MVDKRYQIYFKDIRLQIWLGRKSEDGPNFTIHDSASRVNFDFADFERVILAIDEICSVMGSKEKNIKIKINENLTIYRNFISDLSKDYNFEFRWEEIDKRENVGYSVYLRGIKQVLLVKESLIKLLDKYQKEKWLDEKIHSEGLKSIEFNGKKIEVEKEYGRLDLSNLGIKKITDIKGLKEIQYLKRLNLSNNEIEEINGLDHLIYLRFLNLGRNNIKEIKGLDKLESLEELYLHFNPIDSLKGLEQIDNLIQLSLEGTQVPKELFIEAGIKDRARAQEILKYIKEKEESSKCYEEIKSKTIEYIKKASSVFEEITFSKIRSKTGIELHDLEEIVEDLIFSGKIKAKIRKDGIAFIEENPLIGIALETVDVLHEIKDDTELISQYTSYIEDIFDKTENIEEYLKTHLASEFEKIRNAWQDYKDGKIDKREFIKTGIKEIGKKFVKIFIKKI